MTPNEYRREGAEAMRAAVEAQTLPADWRENPSPKNIHQQRLYMDGVRAIRMAIRALDVDEVLAGLLPRCAERDCEDGNCTWIKAGPDAEAMWRAAAEAMWRAAAEAMHPELRSMLDRLHQKETEMKDREDVIVRAALKKAAWVTNEARKYMASVGAEEEALIMGDITHRILNISTEQVMMSIQDVDGVPSHHPDSVARLVEAARAALNYLENTEGEFGITLESATDIRAALAAMETDHDHT